jgi:predicted helicase
MSFDHYLKSITAALKRGDATEHTHRPALKTLIESRAKGITATNEPKRIACGAPDYIVTKGILPIGYVEAKDVNIDLDDVENEEQLKRYRASLRNLILTDYVEFRYYRNGIPTLTARLGKWQKNGVFKKDADGEKLVADLLKWFLEADVESIGSPRDLAQKMAQLARMIHSLISKAFDAEGERGELHAQFEGFKQVLIADLTPAQFADMYAQTICYGLFAARCNHDRKQGAFTRDAAARDLPKTNPFLRKVFQEIAGHNLDERIAWAVDDLVLLLDRADMSAILADFGKSTRREDPVVHFYETFLAAYDPKLRETRGVYYTPEPVVSYIVRSVDAILKRDFGLKAGLADASKVKVKVSTGKAKGKNGKEKLEDREVHRVQILDPATGTGTFLYAVIEQIRESFEGNAGMWPGYVAEHLLPRIYGFELLIAPYAVAHMKLGLQLKESGYDFESDERLRVYLTNTLEEAHVLSGLPLFAQAIAHEAASASQVKKDAPIMVVIGNPPYSGHSANKGEWVNNLLRGIDGAGNKTANYFQVDGAPLGERNPKWLNDDYVKFIRFSQWRIEQTGYGVLGFITNHGYLDNPTFRGMRQALMATFDDLYLLDLHGNSKKKEQAPDGSKDENVFDIQQGVAIAIFVKHAKRKKPQVHVADLYGSRLRKYAWLAEHNLVSTDWFSASADSPSYFFATRDDKRFSEYMAAHSVSEIFPTNGWGIATRKDYLLVDFDRKALFNRFAEIKKSSVAEASEKFYIQESPHWSFADAHRHIVTTNVDESLKEVLFRPFDSRYVYYQKFMIERGDHRYELMRNLFDENVSLITVRRVEGNTHFGHFFCSSLPSVLHSTSAKEGNFVFPLWLYPKEKQDLFDDPGTERRANLSPEFLAAIETKIGKASPEHIFYYIYAILYSPGYRARYAEFLKRDFPRVPLTSDRSLFVTLAKLGERLVNLHLMNADTAEISRFPVAGSNEVVKVEFKLAAQGELDDSPSQPKAAQPQPSPTRGRGSVNTPPTRLNSDVLSGEIRGRVYINAQQYFDDVPKAVWEYHIGGYQVCQKWLKDRKGRQLSYDDIKHYHGIVAALAETIELQVMIDEAIPAWPIN